MPRLVADLTKVQQELGNCISGRRRHLSRDVGKQARAAARRNPGSDSQVVAAARGRPSNTIAKHHRERPVLAGLKVVDEGVLSHQIHRGTVERPAHLVRDASANNERARGQDVSIAEPLKYGLVCTMTSGGGAVNDKAKHDQAIASIRAAIEANAEYGFPNVIAMSGNRDGIPDDVGIENAVAALKQVAGFAEQQKVTICIEYLNSKVDHQGYMFDNMAWGVEVCTRVGSPNVKILYDIYHAQIMEGDIIRTIQTHKDLIGHYHTGGNPGRHEIDETQELYYPAIMRAIAATGFTGYVAHEFVPTRDPLTSLAQAVEICDI